MGWKLIAIDDIGNAFFYGGNDLKQVMQYLSGTNVASTDSTNKVNVATDTTFNSGRFRIRAPSSGFSYIFDGSNITADRHVILPNMGADGTISLTAANVANDWGNNMQTFRNMFFRWANPTNASFYTVRTEGITASRTVRLPNLTADDDFVFANAVQTLANKTLISPSLGALTINTDTNTIKHSATNNAGDLLVSTGVKYDRFARGGANQVPIMNATGTNLTWIDKASLAGTTPPPTGGTGGDFQVPHVGNTVIGTWMGTSNSGGTGLWVNNLTDLTTGTGNQIGDSSGRIGRVYTLAASDVIAGFRTNNDFFTRQADPELWVRYKMTLSGATTDYRVAIGFCTNVTTIDFNNDLALNNEHGFMWYKDELESTIHLGYNDGDTQQNNSSVVSLSATNESIHTIRLFSDSINSRFGASLDGANASYVTTDIPTSTARLGCFVYFRNENSNTRFPEIYGAYLKCKVI